MTDDQFEQPSRKRHPDGIHRDWWKRPIYIIPDDPEAKTKCGWADETGRHGCNAHVPGKPHQRVTTFIGVLEDTFRLEIWGKRNVAIGLAVADHLVLKVAGEIDPDDPHRNKSAIDKIVEEAEGFALAAAGADSGTALHKLTERLDRGERATVPKANKPDIAAYRKLLADHQLGIEEIEIPIVIDGVSTTKTAAGVGGRFDRILRTTTPCPTCGRYRRIADLKTQKTMEWGENKTAMQLACYALGKRYNAATGERTDLDICQCIGYVLHVPVGKGEATLHRANLLGARGLLGVAYDVWQARQVTGLLEVVPVPDIATSTDERDQHWQEVADEMATQEAIFGLIAIAGDRAAIAALWDLHHDQQGNSTDGWTNEHDLAAQRRVAELEATA